jgi:hypothetical protein
MVAVVEPGRADRVAAVFEREGETVVRLGEVVPVTRGKPRVQYAGHLRI